MQHPLIAIIGRSNVGKSTLFNRLTGANFAITDNMAGTTRDINVVPVNWLDKTFWLADNPGLEKDHQDQLSKTIKRKALVILKEADVLIWLIDGTCGLTNQDRALLKYLKKYYNKIILAINKIENAKIRETYENKKILSFKPLLVSSKTGSGTGDLLDAIINKIDQSIILPPSINVTVLGKPNVGKSSLVNSLAGEERSVVHNTPHTTRDSQKIFLNKDSFDWCLVDTAGIRRRNTAADQIEQKSIGQTLDNLKKSEIIILVLDVSETLSWQDQRLGDLIREQHKPTVVCFTKADLIDFEQQQAKKIEFKKWLPMLSWAPLFFTSAITGENVDQLLPTMTTLINNYSSQISDEEEDWLSKNFKLLLKNNPKFGFLKFSQVSNKPPSFRLVLSGKDNVPAALPDKVEKILRKKINRLSTVPLKIELNTRRGL